MVTQFQERVYATISRIPKGKVATYGDVARALGIGSARAIGQALKCNPRAPVVPCHRVVAAGGALGGFNGERSGPAIQRKIALLRGEGVRIDGTRIEEFSRRRFTF